MKQGKYMALLATLICLGFTGCGKEQPTGDDVSTEDNATAIEENSSNREDSAVESEPANQFPYKYNEEFGNITFRTDLIFPEEVNEDGMNVISASLQQTVDAEKAFQVLMGNIEIEESGEQEGDIFWYRGTDNESLTVQPYSLGYSTKDFSYVAHSFRFQQSDPNYNVFKFSTEDELGFATRQEVFDDIKSTLGALGFELNEDDLWLCYALDHATMQEEEYVMDMDGNIDTEKYKDAWTEEDDAYFVFINQSHKGVSSYHSYYDAFPLAADENAPIQILYGTDGIQFMLIEKVFTFHEDEECYDLKGFPEVVEVIYSKYGMLLGDSTYEVNSAQLYYMESKVTDGKYEVLPVWIFRTTESPSGKILQDIVDARTAKEIVLE